MTFGERLHRLMGERGPLCVGIDPHPQLLKDWGLDDDPAGLERFSRTIVEALAGDVAVLKPQSAFFERHGSRGIAVLETVVADARSAGALVLMDAKRGDIGSTVQAYADAYVDPSSPLCSDAVTASPYLGFGSLRPLIDTALAHGNGVFVLALTSNPEGAEVQHALGPDGRSVAATVLDHVRVANAGGESLGSIGCVVGATVSTSLSAGLGPGGAHWCGEPERDHWRGAATARTRDEGEPERDHWLGVNGPILAPGIGAQGARITDLGDIFGPELPAVVPAVSREILRAGPNLSALKSTAFTINAQAREILIESREFR